MLPNEVARAEVDHAHRVQVAAQRAQMTLIIVDQEGCVRLDSIHPTEYELRLLLSDDRKKLREPAQRVVRLLIDDCLRQDEWHSGIAFLDGQRFVRLTRLTGRDGLLFAVSVENFRGGDSLSRAARKFQLTRREVDVLAMILEGASAAETARSLNIAEATVQGYFKRLLAKTRSRNRPAMVANVLDWGGSGRRSSLS